MHFPDVRDPIGQRESVLQVVACMDSDSALSSCLSSVEVNLDMKTG